MERIKSILISENGMKIVNALFLLSILIRDRGIVFVFYSCWIVYLAYCIRNTKSKATQIIYAVLITFAVVMICVNIYFYFISFISR